MSSAGRKLCFDGQELVQALVMHFAYDEKQGCIHTVTTFVLLYLYVLVFLNTCYISDCNLTKVKIFSDMIFLSLSVPECLRSGLYRP